MVATFSNNSSGTFGINGPLLRTACYGIVRAGRQWCEVTRILAINVDYSVLLTQLCALTS